MYGLSNRTLALGALLILAAIWAALVGSPHPAAAAVPVAECNDGYADNASLQLCEDVVSSKASESSVNALDGNWVTSSTAPVLFAYANTKHVSPPTGVTIRDSDNVWRYNQWVALLSSSQWIEATCTQPTTTVGVQFWGDSNDGWARLKVDGQEVWTGNTYGPTATGFIKYVEVSGLANTAHTLRVEATGKLGAGGGMHVTVFAFGCGPVRSTDLVGTWEFGRSTQNNLPVQIKLCDLTLTDTAVAGKGFEIKSCHPNESFWEMSGAELLFKHQDGTVTTRFRKVGSTDGWEGPYIPHPFYPGDGITHYLRRRSATPINANVQLLDGNHINSDAPPATVAFANVVHVLPPPSVKIESSPGLWRHAHWIALLDSSQFIEATCTQATTTVGVQLWGDANDGWMRVLVDGAEMWRGDTYALTAVGFIKYLEISALPNAPHTIRVESLGLPGTGGGIHATVYAFGCGPRTQSAPVDPSIDTDGDGLADIAETDGVTVDGVFVDLPAMGADPEHKDVFIEIDAMVGNGESHRPSPAAIQLIVDAFANAPVPANDSDPGGPTGIHLHVDYGPDAPLTWGKAATWGALSEGNNLPFQRYLSTCTDKRFNWDGFDAIKRIHFPAARATVFHYNIWAHNLCEEFGTTSGMSRNGAFSTFDAGASDFVVSLGGWRKTIDEQAGTLMHELGHNLGLRHGGPDHINYKPNHLSVMNYDFQSGLTLGPATGKFDYSRYRLPVLNESNLNEAVGIYIAGGGLPTLGTVYRCPDGERRRVANATVVDWNCNGRSTDSGFSQNLNPRFDNNLATLASQNDWDQIVLTGGSVGDTGRGLPVEEPQSTEITEIDQEEYEELSPDLHSLFLPSLFR